MGVMGDEKVNRGKGKGRGSVANAKRLAGLGGRGGVGQADWGNARPEWIAAVVAKVTGLGGAVTFGLSRDQGAHMFTVMLDGEKAVMWFNGDADLDAELEKVFAYLETLEAP